MSEKEQNQIKKMQTTVPKGGDAFEVPDRELEEVSGGAEQLVDDNCLCMCGSGGGCSGSGAG